jgi:hypothetical protein
MKSTTTARNSSITRSLCTGLAANCRLLVAALALGLLVASTGALGDTPGDTGPNYIAGHDYVNYNSNHVPVASGTITDVTASLVNQDGHVFDIYGNELVMHSDNSITNVNNVTVGFVYSGIN